MDQAADDRAAQGADDPWESRMNTRLVPPHSSKAISRPRISRNCRLDTTISTA